MRKVCIECKEEKNIDEFPINGMYRKRQCKICWYEQLNNYRDKNRERINKNQNKNYYKNHESRLEQQAINREKNREIINKRAMEAYHNDPDRKATHKRCQMEYYKNNKDKILENNIIWKRENHDHRVSVNKEWEERNKEKIDQYRKTYLENNKGKRKARITLCNYVARNKGFKPSICSICGKEFASRDITAHHHDHSKPLDVIWCCRKCHGMIHRIIKPLQLDAKSTIH